MVSQSPWQAPNFSWKTRATNAKWSMFLKGHTIVIIGYRMISAVGLSGYRRLMSMPLIDLFFPHWFSWDRRLDGLSVLQFEKTHGNSVLIGRTCFKPFHGMSNILMRRINLFTIAQDIPDDIPVTMDRRHRPKLLAQGGEWMAPTNGSFSNVGGISRFPLRVFRPLTHIQVWVEKMVVCAISLSTAGSAVII